MGYAAERTLMGSDELIHPCRCNVCCWGLMRQKEPVTGSDELIHPCRCIAVVLYGYSVLVRTCGTTGLWIIIHFECALALGAAARRSDKMIVFSYDLAYVV